MSTKSLELDGVLTMLQAVADAVIAAEPELTDADRALGDGDHGVGMERGMNAVKEKLAGDIPSISKAFVAVGTAMMASMGGASGAVYGTFFRTGGKAIDGCDVFDAAALSKFLTAGTGGVMERGGAKPGDKTMVDALVPAAEKATIVSGLPLFEAAEAVAVAAATGRDNSKAMIATMGRAKTLGERSIGHPDAGACSVAIIFRALSDAVQ